MAATGGQRVGAVIVGPHELLEIVIVNAWPLLLRTDEPTKRSLSLVCLNTCALVGDLECDVPAQLHIRPRSCQLNAFRRIEHLVVQGSCYSPLRTVPGLAPQLRRALTGLAARLRDVTFLELHSVPCLSGDCAAAAAACMPRLQQLNLTQCDPPLQPDAHFFSGLTALTHLTALCDASPTTPADTHSLAALTRLTRLELCDSTNAGVGLDLTPLSYLVRLQALSFSPRYVRQGWPHDLTWMRTLNHLETLQHCPPPSIASMCALASCTRLAVLSIYDLRVGGWDEVPPLAHGAAPPHCLPALRDLQFANVTDVHALRGLLHTVRMPALRRLEGRVGLDSNHGVDQSVGDLAEVVSLCPGVSTLRLLLSDFGGEEDAAWTDAMVGQLQALRGQLAAKGRVVWWKVTAPRWQG